MDKQAFVDDMEQRLQSLQLYLGHQTFASPSTLDMSLKQERARPIVGELRGRVDAALALVEQLRTSTAPDWESARVELEQRSTEIEQLQQALSAAFASA